MDKELEKFISWYKQERSKFVSDVYIDKSSWIKKKLLPYSNWDSEHVFSKESDFALRTIAEIGRLNLSKNSISLAVLTLSNRSEYIGDQSELYTTYAGLIVFSLAILGVSMSIGFKAILGLVLMPGVIYCLHKRLNLRTEVAMCKEIVNLLKEYEARHA